MKSSYLSSAIKQFEYYKMLGEKAMAQLPDDAVFWQSSEESNSISIIVKHMVGNMLSRFTEFLTSDGEKDWRNRDDEFINSFISREELVASWNDGWDCVFGALAQLTDQQLEDVVYIRNEGHTITEALHRQLAHYSYHIGQIVCIAKMIKGEGWESLSIPRNSSTCFRQMGHPRLILNNSRSSL